MSGKLVPYEKYKDSGVDWLGLVPDGWKVRRIRFMARLNPSRSELVNVTPEQLVSFLPMEAVGEDGSLNLEGERRLSDVETGYTYFAHNDVTYAKITPCFENGKGALMEGMSNGFGFGTTELTVLRPNAETLPKFLWYTTTCSQFRKVGEAHMYGAGGQKRVPDDFARDFHWVQPSFSEQQAIANYLDDQTQRIDSLIKEQRELIELLREKRQALIAHAVTKGINSKTKMKDSGVAWLGKIPETWQVRKLTNLAQLESGHTPSRQHPEWWIPEECVHPWFSLADVHQLRDEKNVFVAETNEMVSDLGLANSSARLLPKGTVILSRTASVGFSGILSVEMATTQDFVNWICGSELYNVFLLYVLRAMKPEFKRLIMGSTHQTIYMPEAMAFVIPHPSIQEQRQIAEHIETQLKRIDAVIAEAESTITLMQEHRSALISAVVTGKVRVPA